MASVQITLSDDLGVDDRGAFYKAAGCLHDVIQSHRFQIVALLATEPPSYRGLGAMLGETAGVIQAMRPRQPHDLVRGQYAGEREERNVTNGSDKETFCALRLDIDSWRWAAGPSNSLRLTKQHRATTCKRGSWGPNEAGAPIAAYGRWYNPMLTDATSD